MVGEKNILSLDLGSFSVRGCLAGVSKDGNVLIKALCEKNCNSSEDFEKTVASVISETQHEANVKCDGIVVSNSAIEISTLTASGSVSIDPGSSEISQKDVRNVIEVARSSQIPQDRELIHVLIQDYTVDGKEKIKDPIGMDGRKLDCRVLLVTALKSETAGLRSIIQKQSSSPVRFVISQIADSEALLSKEDKDAGCVLINIGSDSTSMIVYTGSAASFCSKIPYGAANITKDIACLFNISFADAESLKNESGACFLDSVDPAERCIIKINESTSVSLPKQELAKIIEPRMAEIFSMLKTQLDDKFPNMNYGDNLILTGGGSLLSGVPSLASQIFGMNSKLGYPVFLEGLDRSFINPKYSTVLGLVKVESRHLGGTINNVKTKTIRENSVFKDKISSLFRKMI